MTIFLLHCSNIRYQKWPLASIHKVFLLIADRSFIVLYQNSSNSWQLLGLHRMLKFQSVSSLTLFPTILSSYHLHWSILQTMTELLYPFSILFFLVKSLFSVKLTELQRVSPKTTHKCLSLSIISVQIVCVVEEVVAPKHPICSSTSLTTLP